ncbi:hypothetical protein KW841_18400 [Pseudomonas sp. PDM28]|uniref:hypothetical protein n=1 Tax=Pseudomonas sp. PDM28 TaxID=2854770 RepID=UPI001C43DE5A|nr:hypothetical protein [Pseudomonas sp. PDM28]MBV7554322.1 hypothetical protein [Pseudomonas sp. PDM28]
MEHLRLLIGSKRRLIAFTDYQNGLGWPVLSTICQTSGARSSSCRKCDKTFACAAASTG